MRRISRTLLVVAAIVALVALYACAPAYTTRGGTRTYLGFSLGISNSPPPTLSFSGEPRYDRVEESDVQVIDSPDPDCDLFQLNGTCYMYRAGFWYQSSRYDGPYHPIEVHRVPRQVLDVPEGHWHHRPHRDSDDRGDHGDHGNH